MCITTEYIGAPERPVVNSTVCISSFYTSVNLLWPPHTNYTPNCIVNYSVFIKDYSGLAVLALGNANSTATSYTFTDLPDPVGGGYQFVVVAIDTANRTRPASNVFAYSPSAIIVTIYGKCTNNKQPKNNMFVCPSFVFGL